MTAMPADPPLPQVDLLTQAQALPAAWASVACGRVDGASIRALRMDAQPHPDEAHPHAEALLVLQGELRLRVAGRPQVVPAGQMVVVPAGTAHAVEPGSHGALLIIR